MKENSAMDNQAICPICKSHLEEPIESEKRLSGDKHLFNCRRCGKYILTGSVLHYLPTVLENQERMALLSHLLRKMQSEKAIPLIDSYLLEELLKRQLPSLAEQINNLILWLGNITNPGGDVFTGIEIYQTIMGAKTEMGTYFVINHLNDNKLVNFRPTDSYEQIIALTMPGWDYYNELKRGAIMSRKAFMAMKFGDIDLDSVFENCFKPAVKATGFELYKLDEKPQAGLIDDRLRVEM